jgi:hypothetical protein
MSQTLHILKKDIRYLRLEISLFLLLTALYALTELYYWANHLGTRALLTVSGVFLIARLVHAEAMPGANQFWISRRYRWTSLLGEKLLFIFVFVNLPILIARLIILLFAGFPLSWSLPGLLWSQLLIMFVACLPIAALATLTARLPPFVFSLLVILAVALGMEQMMVPPSLPAERTLIDGVQWIWDAAATLALSLAAVLIVCTQYSKRNTSFNRRFAIIVASLAAAAYLYIPWPFALALQTQLSQRGFDSSSIHAELIASEKRGYSVVGKLPEVELDLPIKVTGVPEAINVEADALAVSFQGPNGWTWKSGAYHLPGLKRKVKRASDAIFNCLVLMPRAPFNEERQQSVTLRASLYLTLFGNDRSKTIPLKSTPVNVLEGLQCGQGPIIMSDVSDVYCRSAFRWPERQVYAKSEDPYLSPFSHPISYSPFPAGLSLDNIETGGASIAKTAHELTIVTKEPINHIRLDFEIPSIKLKDFVECEEGPCS